jgi:Domain of unknown function (DUF222)
MKELDNLVEAVDAITTMAAPDRTRQEIAETLRVVACQVNRLQAVISEYMSAMARTGAHETAGHRTPVEFLKNECHYSGAQARIVARSGEVLDRDLPATSAALRAGTITWPHATTLVRGVEALGSDEVASSEEIWIDNIAKQSGPERLQRAVRARVHEKSPEREQKPSRDHEESKEISLRRLSGRGYEVTGFVSPKDGDIIEHAISTLKYSEPKGEDVDSVVAIVSQWLQQQSTSRREQARERDSFVTLFERTREVDHNLAKPALAMSRLEETVPTSLAGSGTPRVSVMADSSRDYCPSATEAHCHHPGCAAEPRWCDYHSIVRVLTISQLEAA